jgi:4-diphosphocytidyl-2-C-methyl-D-erythritol kinase
MKKLTIKSYAKINIFLKIVGNKDGYHNIVSRFHKVKSLYDTITFDPNNSTGEFELIGDFSCDIKDNSIYKAFLILRQSCPKIDAYFRVYSIKVEKNIPHSAGLGGGSSNAAAFLILANSLFDLNYSKSRLVRMGLKVGCDVPFFIYEYDSANVSGVGEIVEEFREDDFDIDVFTPDIKCSTKDVFEYFSRYFYDSLSDTFSDSLFDDYSSILSLSSVDILKRLDINSANDLYKSAMSLYPSLKKYYKKELFFSGSGSSFFRLKSSKSL